VSEYSSIESKPVTVYLGVGSNLGDRIQNLRQALALLASYTEIQRISPIYETLPVGNTAQPRFLNLVCVITTSLTPFKLLFIIKNIETQMGRMPGLPNSPRLIDMDILFHGEQVLETPKLEIPHPRLVDRAFVLVPLADIAPELKHPVCGKTIREMLNELRRSPQDVVPWDGK
jgi:2-amino-4-hydroxy-6-hydroxymethyldihydropteridine diphosphokinase